MITRQDLILKNEWWGNAHCKIKESNWVKRDLYAVLEKNLKHPLMLNIVGLRRVGKSTLLKQLISYFLAKGVPPKNIFYFLFDYTGQSQSANFLEEVLTVYLKEILSKPTLSLGETVYVLLDEIQYIDNWHAILKKYYDLSGKKIKFIITGSQSLLLKNKHQESLAGRIFDFYLPPLSFREFLKINRETIKIPESFNISELPKRFVDLNIYNANFGGKISEKSSEYITTGQFPEIRQIVDPERKREYIVESILGKILEDCIRIFKIEKPDAFKLVARQLLDNIGSIFELKNIGREVGLSFVTLDKYIEYLSESYVVDVLYKYHKSLIKRGRILKKLYAPCINFTCALNRYKPNHMNEVPQAFGKIIENTIYNVLIYSLKGSPSKCGLYFWRKGEKEVDFIVTQERGKIPIEVKFSNNISQKELMTLMNYMKDQKSEFGIVITRNELDKKKINGQTFYFLPYYLILLMV